MSGGGILGGFCRGDYVGEGFCRGGGILSGGFCRGDFVGGGFCRCATRHRKKQSFQARKFRTLEACNSRSSGRITLGQKRFEIVTRVNNISKTHSSTFLTHPANCLEKKRTGGGGQHTLGPAPLRGVCGRLNLTKLTSHLDRSSLTGN